MKNKNLDVAVIGELNIDLVLRDIAMPENEKEKLAQDMRFTMGSSSAITAHNLAALGTRVGFVGKAGLDAFGRYMVDQLTAGGVDTRGIQMQSNLKTGATIVLANPPYKALLTYMGAMRDLTMADLNWDYITEARHLHVGCFFLQTGIRPDAAAIFARARNLGLTTSLDTNWDPDEQWGEELLQTLPQTDLFFPNEDEAMRIARAATVEEAIAKLRKLVKILVVKRGAQGATVCAGEESWTAPAYRVEAVETTGAGDSFNAGFLHGWLQGKSPIECMEWGNACGALAVTEMGGTEAFKELATVWPRLRRIIDGR